MPAVLFTAVPPSNQVDLEPRAVFCQRGGVPGPSTIWRPFAARMFIDHIRFGARREGAPATLMVSPTLRFSGVAFVRRKMLSELASMSQVIAFPFGSVVRTMKWTCGFCQETSTSVPSISIVVRSIPSRSDAHGRPLATAGTRQSGSQVSAFHDHSFGMMSKSLLGNEQLLGDALEGNAVRVDSGH